MREDLNYKHDGKALDFLGDTDILILGEMVRYNNRRKIKEENVAEHSFYVAANCLKILDLFNIEDELLRLKTLEYAIVHDIPEKETGDIPYNVKQLYPELDKILDQVEEGVLFETSIEFAKYFQDYFNSAKLDYGCIKKTAYTIVSLADTVSVLQYSNDEISLGNRTEEMELINVDSRFRVMKLLEILKEDVGIKELNYPNEVKNKKIEEEVAIEDNKCSESCKNCKS